MKSRTILLAIAVCVVLAPLTGCGGTGHATPAPGGAGASREPTPGKGSKDPDDINGDGYRDLMVPIPDKNQPAVKQPDGRPFAVIYGSAKGPDPSTRTLYKSHDLPGSPNEIVDLDVADLDSDGFPDFVTTVRDKKVPNKGADDHRTAPYVAWGGPSGPKAGGTATPVRLPQSASKLGLDQVVRGDFDGDGHQDLAAHARTELSEGKSPLVVLYGPFTRSGAPTRTDTSLSVPQESDLVVDDVAPSGKPHATSLLVHDLSDGEQSGNTLYPARTGNGLSASGKRLRPGNAHAFGDFDGDGLRDVAVGDDGSRNDEPDAGTEPPEVDGSLDVYPGSGDKPVKYRLPKGPEGKGTDYGPGGFSAADPDGDGRDGILVATYEEATLMDGDKRTRVLREGDKGSAECRHARPVGADDFDADGKDELILNWASDGLFCGYGEDPTHWWITDGTTSRDKASFTVKGIAPRS
ncbi:hypothetical protein [Streptomyces sp. NPDC001165]|uniref:hypothetical protein n=1 Tax=Streptomyces sp. NPDC001165 TaxID=3364546 RepID=UPI00368A0948